MKEELVVGVCIPSQGKWESAFGRSLAVMMSRFAQERVGAYRKQRMHLINSEGSMLSQLRESLVAEALRKHCDYLLCLDSDMTFPPDTFHRLWRHQKDFVAANCVIKKVPSNPTAVGLNGEWVYSDPEQHGLEEVQHVGIAVALIDARVVRRCEAPLFVMGWSSALKAYTGEDVHFCQKLKAQGAKLFVDHDLSREVGHVGSMTYTHDLVGRVMREEVA